jgi:hypothetical protein
MEIADLSRRRRIASEEQRPSFQWHTRMRSALDCEGKIKTKTRRWNLLDPGSRNRHRSFALLAPRGCPGFLVSSIFRVEERSGLFAAQEVATHALAADIVAG